MAGTSWVTKTNKHNQKRKKADQEKMLEGRKSKLGGLDCNGVMGCDTYFRNS